MNIYIEDPQARKHGSFKIAERGFSFPIHHHTPLRKKLLEIAKRHENKLLFVLFTLHESALYKGYVRELLALFAPPDSEEFRRFLEMAVIEHNGGLTKSFKIHVVNVKVNDELRVGFSIKYTLPKKRPAKRRVRTT